MRREPMRGKTADIFYFSGTGNTKKIAQIVGKELTERGLEVSLFKMEKETPLRKSTSEVLGLAAPVICFTSYPLVWRFLHWLPRGNGKECFLIATCGGFLCDSMLGPIGDFLDNRGYTLVGATSIKMAHNVRHRNKDADSLERIMKLGEDRAREFAGELVEGKTTWRESTFRDKILTTWGRTPFPWLALKLRYKPVVDENLCNGCGLCVSECPVNNIGLVGGKTKIDERCEVCSRCVAICPQDALSTGIIQKKIALDHNRAEINPDDYDDPALEESYEVIEYAPNEDGSYYIEHNKKERLTRAIKDAKEVTTAKVEALTKVGKNVVPLAKESSKKLGEATSSMLKKTHTKVNETASTLMDKTTSKTKEVGGSLTKMMNEKKPIVKEKSQQMSRTLSKKFADLRIKIHRKNQNKDKLK